jgi:thymidylate synthase
MKQYHDHLKNILKSGTLKPAAREGMPGTISLFGYHNRYNLAEGFPLLTTKKIKFEHIITELIWFLRGDTNIKFLIDNGFMLWNEDAYQYYEKKCKEQNIDRKISFELFCSYIKNATSIAELTADSLKNSIVDCPLIPKNYTLGDCGYQYGKVWRGWDGQLYLEGNTDGTEGTFVSNFTVDQIKEVLYTLKNSPQGRRHIVTAMDPAHDKDLALYWCHNMFQFNCRPLTIDQRWDFLIPLGGEKIEGVTHDYLDTFNVPKYFLDCQLYQRSADMFLGVPFNIASYALLTHIFAELLNMVPGDFIHTFGDSHIYEDHMEAVELLLSRTPKKLPTLSINTEFWQTESGECGIGNLSIDGFLHALTNDHFIKCFKEEDIQLSNYEPDAFIKANLSTGLKK